MPFGIPRSESNKAVGAAVTVVVRERRRVMIERVGICILLEFVGMVVVGRRERGSGWMW